MKKNKKINYRRFTIYLFILILISSSTLALIIFNEKSSAITQINSTACSNSGSTTLDCTIPATSAGNQLVYTLGVRGVKGLNTIPNGFNSAVSLKTPADDLYIDIYYNLNIGAGITSLNWSFSNSVKASVVVTEYSGIASAGALDQTATNFNSFANTSPSTGTTSTTTQAEEIWIGGIANNGSDTISSPTNSFSIVNQAASGGGSPATRSNVSYLERIVSTTGTASTSATLSGSQLWAGGMATFRAASTPSQIAYSTGARTVTAGACSGAANVITVQLQNGSGVPTNPSGATVVRLSSNSSGAFTVYSDDTCSTTLTDGDISFTTAENSKNVYVTDTRKSNPTWTLTATKQSGPDTLTSANQNLTINAGAVARLIITLPGQTFTDGTGNSGTPTARTAGVGFNITSISATDQFLNLNTGYGGAKTLVYSGPTNSLNATAPSYTTAVSFTSGQSTTTLATTLYRAQSTTITVTDAGSLGFASSTVAINPGNISGDVSDSSVSGSSSATVSNPLTVTITLLDTWGNPISGVAAANITLSGTSTPTITQPSGSTDVNGQITGSLTWSATGSEIVSAAISGVSLVQDNGTTADSNGLLDDTHAVTVTLAAPSSSTIQGGAIIQGGTIIQ